MCSDRRSSEELIISIQEAAFFHVTMESDQAVKHLLLVAALVQVDWFEKIPWGEVKAWALRSAIGCEECDSFSAYILLLLQRCAQACTCGNICGFIKFFL